ncbi:unnamed protein product [Parnassius apollo]|uniref:(apollo) hypothetical protein n=1 Tax=Parnassius apollo TaxID=110799 RepID=A0A8S3WXM3_PARAO|nr:unnamed protein product [Parnassius apollo]
MNCEDCDVYGLYQFGPHAVRLTDLPEFPEAAHVLAWNEQTPQHACRDIFAEKVRCVARAARLSPKTELEHAVSGLH